MPKSTPALNNMGLRSVLMLILVAMSVTIVLFFLAPYHLGRQPRPPPPTTPFLTSAPKTEMLRAGAMELESFRKQVLIEKQAATHATRGRGDVVMELTADARNAM